MDIERRKRSIGDIEPRWSRSFEQLWFIISYLLFNKVLFVFNQVIINSITPISNYLNKCIIENLNSKKILNIKFEAYIFYKNYTLFLSNQRTTVVIAGFPQSISARKTFNMSNYGIRFTRSRFYGHGISEWD